MTGPNRSGLSDRQTELLSRLHDAELSGRDEQEANELLAENELALAFFAELTALSAQLHEADPQAAAAPQPKRPRVPAPASLKRSTSETLARLHRRSDRSNKKTVVVLGSLLLGFLVLIIVAVQAGREDAEEQKMETAKLAAAAAAAVPQPEEVLPERLRLAQLRQLEGEVFNTLDATRPLPDATEIWDGESLQSAAASGGVLRFLAGGSIEFGPHSELKVGTGAELLARLQSGFLALDFRKKGAEGRIELSDFGSVEVIPGLRLVVHMAPESAAPMRSLYLHARRGEARLRILGEDLVLVAGASAALEFERVGEELQLRRRVAFNKLEKSAAVSASVGSPKQSSDARYVVMAVANGEKKVVADPRRLESLDFKSRILARDLIDQANGLADGETVGVDMFTYLNEKSSLDSELQILGLTEGDIESDVVITHRGEVLVQGPLVKLGAKLDPALQRRFERMFGEALSPVLGPDQNEQLMMLTVQPDALSALARIYVTVPDEYQGERVFVRASLMKYVQHLIRAVATQLGCDIVNTDDYGIALVPKTY